MSVQDLESADPNVRGAIKGSHPIDGEYMAWRYPNWAAKFFMDALMLLELCPWGNERRLRSPPRSGPRVVVPALVTLLKHAVAK